MSQLTLVEIASSNLATVASGKGAHFVDSTVSLPAFKNDGGRYFILSPHTNTAVAAQGAGFASDTYVTGSNLLVPTFGLQVNGTFRWTISASKTGAGVAQPVYTIRVGSAGTTADTAILALTGPAQTAIADIGTFNLVVSVRTVGSGTAAVIAGTAWWQHRGTAASSTGGTGFANDGTGHIEGTSAGFDSTTWPGKNIGLSINGGASAAWTMTQAIVEANW